MEQGLFLVSVFICFKVSKPKEGLLSMNTSSINNQFLPENVLTFRPPIR